MWHSDFHKLFALMGQGNYWVNKKERERGKNSKRNVAVSGNDERQTYFIENFFREYFYGHLNRSQSNIIYLYQSDCSIDMDTTNFECVRNLNILFIFIQSKSAIIFCLIVFYVGKTWNLYLFFLKYFFFF